MDLSFTFAVSILLSIPGRAADHSKFIVLFGGSIDEDELISKLFYFARVQTNHKENAKPHSVKCENTRAVPFKNVPKFYQLD